MSLKTPENRISPQSVASPLGGTYLPCVLSVISGMVDVTSWLTLGELFAAHVTGNMVTICATIAKGQLPHLIQILAIPLFVVGAIGSDLLSRWLGGLRIRQVRGLLLAQAAFLVCACTIAGATYPMESPQSLSANIVGASAVLAMSVQNALVRLSYKQAPTTAIMTGNLVVVTLALMSLAFDRGETRSVSLDRLQATWPLLVGFIGGCLLGASAVAICRDWAWVVPTIVSSIVAGSPWRFDRNTSSI